MINIQEKFGFGRNKLMKCVLNQSLSQQKCVETNQNKSKDISIRGK